MEMSLEMRPVMQIRLSMKQYIPKEFQHYISLDGDKDLPLLNASLPFLVLHEVSHPLFDEGYINVPDLVPKGQFAKYVTEMGYQQALETGLDKAAIDIGQQVCGFSRTWMYGSHLAIARRVYRDMFEQRRQPLDEGLMARLEAELRYHSRRAPQELKEKIGTLRGCIHRAVKRELQPRGMFGIYEDMVRSYAAVYDKTVVRGPECGE